MNAQDSFLQAAPERFKGLATSTIELRRALAFYLAEGLRLGFSQGALIDFLGVSSPSILELSNFSEIEQKHTMTLLGVLTDIEIKNAAKYV